MTTPQNFFDVLHSAIVWTGVLCPSIIPLSTTKANVRFITTSQNFKTRDHHQVDMFCVNMAVFEDISLSLKVPYRCMLPSNVELIPNWNFYK